MKKSGETAGVRNLEESEGKPSTTLKVTTGAMASGVVSMCTLVMFHLVVCRVSPLIFASTFVASVFSGAFAAVESGMGSSNTGNVSESSKKGREAGNADSSNASGSTGTSFGCVSGLVIGMVAAYYAKSTEEPWRS